MDYVCEVCGKTFHAKPSRINVRFCSWDCTAKERATRKSIETCAHCGKEFTRYASTRTGKYCSKGCATTARNLTAENPAYRRDISGAKNPMYGRGMIGPANPMYGKIGPANPQWKGGRKVRRDGYVLVIAPDGHPNPSDKSRGRAYILEHRLIMEQHLGRYLEAHEVVHHIDENPNNNALSNLRLYASQSEHIRDAHSD
jgi:hypothetical protein